MTGSPRYLMKTVSIVTESVKEAWRTITCNHKELVVIRNIVNSDLWKGSDDLLLWGKVGAFFELEVAYRSGEREIAVHASEVDETTCGANSCFFTCENQLVLCALFKLVLTLILGLVIERQRFRPAFYAEHAA